MATTPYTFSGISAGNYKVTAGQGIGYNGSGGLPCAVYGGWPATYGPFPLNQGPQLSIFVSQGQIINYNQDPGLPNGPVDGNGYQCYNRSSFTFPATVGSDGNLVLSMAAPGTIEMGGYYPTSLSTLKIEADPAAPHLSIDMTGYSDAVKYGPARPAECRPVVSNEYCNDVEHPERHRISQSDNRALYGTELQAAVNGSRADPGCRCERQRWHTDPVCTGHNSYGRGLLNRLPASVNPNRYGFSSPRL